MGLTMMDERDLAAELQRTKDDPEEWGDVDEQPSTRPKQARRLAAMVSVRFAPEELAKVQRRASERGQTVSSFLRDVAMQNVSAHRSPSQLTGMVNVSTADIVSMRCTVPRIAQDGSRLETTAG
jgi:predicted DNA binding CopG/RHH family protein